MESVVFLNKNVKLLYFNLFINLIYIYFIVIYFKCVYYFDTIGIRKWISTINNFPLFLGPQAAFHGEFIQGNGLSYSLNKYKHYVIVYQMLLKYNSPLRYIIYIVTY